MHQSNTLHHLCIVTQLIPNLHRILHMINVEHHETIQMTFRQATMPKRSPFTCSCFIKLIAAIDKCRRIILNLLSIGQQFLPIAFCSPSLYSSLFLQILLFQQKLLIVSTIEPSLDSRYALSLRSIYSRNDRPTGINPPSRIRFLYLFPEHFLRTRKCLREMSIFLKCEHLFFF